MALKGHIPWNKGILMSEQTKKNISNSKKGNIPWNKGLTGEEYKSHFENGFKGIFKKGHIFSKEVIKKRSKKMMGHIGYMLGKHHFKETKLKMSLAKKDFIPWNKGKTCPQLSGANKPNWKNGITSLVKQIRKNFKYRQWRDDVFTRDDFTCQECGQRGFILNAHHIKSFSLILQKYEITTLEEALVCEELWNINNGITLCEECHREIY